MANIFALRDLSLNAFLFSDVGVEANGTSLTILSLLARLGKILGPRRRPGPASRRMPRSGC